MLLARQRCITHQTHRGDRVALVQSRPRGVRCNSSFMPVELIAAAGDVDAPLAVPIAAALVVTAAITFAVPAYLSRGQEAADKIFASKQQKPLDVGRKAAKTTKGRTASSKRR